jgi:hypothetical protein
MVDSQKYQAPTQCEACNVPLDSDLSCPKCGVWHAGEPCDTCGRFGYHKDDCMDPPRGNCWEGGPAFLRRMEKILWYVKEVNLYNGEDVAEYATNFWRDLLDRVL